MSSERERYDVVVVGAGHNGLIAAAYLGRAGLSVLVLERGGEVGGGTSYSPVVGLPQQICDDLDLHLEIGEPVRPAVPAEHPEHGAWRELEADLADLAHAIRPTLLEPLPVERDVRERVDAGLWRDFVTQPLATTLEQRFDDDWLRGAAGARGLLDTFRSLRDPSLAPNRTFLYRSLVPGGVPVGGTAALTASLEQAARGAGVEVVTGAGVSEVRGDADGARVTWHDGTRFHSVAAGHVLGGVAPWILHILLGSADDPETKPAGSTLVVRLLLDARPDDLPEVFGVATGLAALEAAYAEAAAGALPTAIPGEVRGTPAPDGRWELTFTGLHVPAALFADDPDAVKRHAVDRALAGLGSPVADRVSKVLEVRGPLDVEATLAMPGGHLWHGDLDWPWASNRALLDTPARAWGVQTDVPTVLVCGSGARRGGGVTGLGGHNAAQAVLASR